MIRLSTKISPARAEPKLQQWALVAAVVATAEDEGVEVVVVDSQVKGVEDLKAASEAVAIKEAKIVVVEARVEEVQVTQDTRPSAMLTCPRSRRASGTGPLGSRLIFVWSRPHVLGRSTLHPGPIIETLTSSHTEISMKK